MLSPKLVDYPREMMQNKSLESLQRPDHITYEQVNNPSVPLNEY